jgi:thiol-disulfide isomerase/thioredoxin
MSAGLWVLLVAVAVAVGFGSYRAATDGRFRGTHEVRGVEPVAQVTDDRPAVAYDGDLGERATLLQFSSAFCAPCRAARRTLGEVATAVPGVRHVEVDAESDLELVRRLGIMRTPTTLVLDARGREVTRASGAPTKDQVLTALALVGPK